MPVGTPLEPRAALSLTAKRAGWQGFIYDLRNAQGRVVRLKYSAKSRVARASSVTEVACAAPLDLRNQRRRENMSLVTQLLSTWYRQWSRNSSHISNSAKHDGLAAHSDTRTIRGQIDHDCIGRRVLRRWSDDWIVPSTLKLPHFAPHIAEMLTE